MNKSLIASEDIVSAGSQVKVDIQGKSVVLPVDKDFAAMEVLSYLSSISPSLGDHRLYKEEGTNMYHAMPV